jgi:hypothetical protein
MEGEFVVEGEQMLIGEAGDSQGGSEFGDGRDRKQGLCRERFAPRVVAHEQRHRRRVVPCGGESDAWNIGFGTSEFDSGLNLVRKVSGQPILEMNGSMSATSSTG